MGQKPSEGKRVHNIFQSCLIKNLARKTQWDKTIDKGKRVQRILLPPSSQHELIFLDLQSHVTNKY